MFSNLILSRTRSETWISIQHIDQDLEQYLNKTKDWALVQNAASASDKVELGLFR